MFNACLALFNGNVSVVFKMCVYGVFNAYPTKARSASGLPVSVVFNRLYIDCAGYVGCAQRVSVVFNGCRMCSIHCVQRASVVFNGYISVVFNRYPLCSMRIGCVQRVYRLCSMGIYPLCSMGIGCIQRVYLVNRLCPTGIYFVSVLFCSTRYRCFSKDIQTLAAVTE